MLLLSFSLFNSHPHFSVVFSRQELVRLINSNQVLVVSGETGCGKTTQVTQFILDDHINRGLGSLCRVICTQPRRISAISVRPPPVWAPLHFISFFSPLYLNLCVLFFFSRLQNVWQLREQKVWGIKILVVTRFVCRGMKVRTASLLKGAKSCFKSNAWGCIVKHWAFI